MCDQDHFEDDLHEYEKRGLITRRQFGVLLGAGACMVLPQVANAVAVTESDVTITTPDGTAEAHFVRPATGTAPGVLVWPDIFGLRPAFRQMGKRLAESGYAVVVVNQFYRAKKLPIAANGANTPIPDLIPLAQALNERQEDRDTGLLHGRPDGVPHCRSDARPRRRCCFVPRWWPRYRKPEQSAPAGFEDQGAVPYRGCVERRSEIAERKEHPQGDFREG